MQWMAIQASRHKAMHVAGRLSQHTPGCDLIGYGRKHTRSGSGHHGWAKPGQPIEMTSHLWVLLHHHRLQIVAVT